MIRATRTTWMAMFAASTLLALSGCSGGEAEKQQAANGHDGHRDHSGEHDHAPGPHDGTIVDWGGGKFHVEFTVDHDKQEVAVYVLGRDEKTAVPISATQIHLNIKDPAIDVALAPSPQTGDPEGSASRFVGMHDGFAVVKDYEGSISGVVDGTPYSGEFSEEEHDHDDGHENDNNREH